LAKEGKDGKKNFPGRERSEVGFAEQTQLFLLIRQGGEELKITRRRGGIFLLSACIRASRPYLKQKLTAGVAAGRKGVTDEIRRQGFFFPVGYERFQ
jgi:hypothetical protein